MVGTPFRSTRGRQRCITELAKPLWIGIRAVKLVTRLVKFELACLAGLRRFRQKSCNLRVVQWLKTAGSLERLLMDGHRVVTPQFYANRLLLDSGKSRMRLPVAAKIALQNAATNGGTPGSPTPAGGAELSVM